MKEATSEMWELVQSGSMEKLIAATLTTVIPKEISFLPDYIIAVYQDEHQSLIVEQALSMLQDKGLNIEVQRYADRQEHWRVMVQFKDSREDVNNKSVSDLELIDRAVRPYAYT